MYALNATHSRDLVSWVESANQPDTDFPIQNLPYCVFQTPDNPASIGIGIGDQILNLRACGEAGLLSPDFASASQQSTLNQLMAFPPAQQSQLRARIVELLSEGSPEADKIASVALVAQTNVDFLMPCNIGDYSDFYASVYHATNVGSMFRPDNPLLPNYKHIPIGYHGRASSIVVSGTPIRRPVGQLTPAEPGAAPTRDACKLFDYELEVGCLVGQGNQLGESVSIDDAESHMFGLTLLNDWSARDIQKWEYQPLGPFLAKSFASTISPWVVTMEALAPFRCPEFQRDAEDPRPLDYLASDSNSQFGGIDLQLEVFLSTEQMQQQGLEPQLLTRGSFTNLYWTFAQMLTHHSSNGCNLRPGDMLGSGTVSGLTRDSRGCMLELTWDGDQQNALPGSQRTPIELPTGEKRKFLADGDSVIFRGFCETSDHRRIGFGICMGQVLPATQST
ncbi:MAG: fumarylacetoacetase [Planctomycetaceae bacterium]|nr:fumarylacetoacetase [Planctomycetaceae bacterium]MCP4480507.1 fumarylacetoacetase [Planctomycetaceae bacterium]MCP4778964.1 fumarylacetoacetase [Planctomycetaceae bacterium]